MFMGLRHLFFKMSDAVSTGPGTCDQIGFPRGSDGKESSRNAGDQGSIPG